MNMTSDDVTLEDLKNRAKYSTLQICRILNIKRERFRDWMEQEHIKPTLPVSDYSLRAGFTYSDIFGIAIFKMLVEKGYKRSLVAKIMSELIGNYDGILDRCAFFLIMFSKDESGAVVTEATAFLSKGDKMTITFDTDTISFEELQLGAVSEWDDVEIINLLKLRQEVEEGIKNM